MFCCHPSHTKHSNFLVKNSFSFKIVAIQNFTASLVFLHKVAGVHICVYIYTHTDPGLEFNLLLSVLA